VRSDVELQPQIFGGPQEGSLRAGTENMPGIVGLGAAMKFVRENRQGQFKRLGSLRAWLAEQLSERIPGMIVNGPEKQVAPHVLSVSFPGADGEMMLIRLNGEGIAVSLGSACTTKTIEPSHVLTAMGLPGEQIDGTLRISLGHPTTEAELERLVEVLPEVVELARG
jgi:cysteine desulfurase